MSTIKHIRKNIFGATQTQFAEIVGVGQATVCRWEKNTSPTLEDMKAIRDAAIARGLEWSDAYFFDETGAA